MDAILGRRAFPGPTIDVGSAGATFAGEATFDGCIALAPWPRADVERLLPAELELAVNVGAQGGTHPVVFAFGEQTRGTWIWGGLTLPIGLDYFEFLVAIPFVRHRSGHMLHTYIPRMYASNPPSVWDGNARYALSKELAAMRWWGTTFVLTSEDGDLLFHAVVERGDEEGAAPALRTIREMFALPVLGRRETGEYVCSYFAWDFGSALVRGAAASLSIDAPLASGFAPRVFHGSDSGTVTVRGMKWKLSWPVSCRF